MPSNYSYLGREFKRADKEAYINELCRSIEDANHQNKTRLIYQGVKLICGRKVSRVGTSKDKNGTPLSDMEQIKSRWNEHFNELYNVKITADTTCCWIYLSAMRVISGLWMSKLMLHRDYYERRWNGPYTT